MIDFTYDALLLVHADYRTIGDTTLYEDNLAEMVDLLRQKGIKIFHEKHDESRHNKSVRDLLDMTAITMPPSWGQEDVYFISMHLKKEPSEIELGIGGIYGRGCVHTYATSICKEIEVSYRPAFPRMKAPPNPISFGGVIDFITVRD